MTIEQVLERNEAELLLLPGVTGVGIGEHEGRAVILVMLERHSPELLARLPRSLEGHPVRVEEIGSVTAF